MGASNGNAMQDKNCTVYFDGACSVCRKEIATYKKWRGGDRIEWVDASDLPVARK